MENIEVEVYPDRKTVKAYRYSDNVIIIPGTVIDTDESVVTDIDGFRYKRKIVPGSSLFEYWRI